MKLWSLQTIANLWLLGIAAGYTSTAALAENIAVSVGRLESSDTQSQLLAQANAVLEVGSVGSAVKDLQAMLSLMGYYSAEIDGNYGDATSDAVMKFQNDAGLTADGVVGPATWQRLLPTPATLNRTEGAKPVVTSREESQTPDPSNPSDNSPADIASSDVAGDLPVLQLDDYGPDVTTLQRRLAVINVYTGPVDGIFGLGTEQAVEQFQRQVGLGADGVVGPATWAELLK